MAEILKPGTPGHGITWTKVVLCEHCGAEIRLGKDDLYKEGTGILDGSYHLCFDCPCCNEKQRIERRSSFRDDGEYEDVPFR